MDDWQGLGAIAAMVVMGVARQEHRGPGTALLAESRLSRFAAAQTPVSLCDARHSGTAAGFEEKGAAPAPREGETGAGAQAAWGQGRAQHHDTGRKGGVVIQFDFRPEGAHRTNERSPMGGLRTTCPPVSPARLRG